MKRSRNKLIHISKKSHFPFSYFELPSNESLSYNINISHGFFYFLGDAASQTFNHEKGN